MQSTSGSSTTAAGAGGFGATTLSSSGGLSSSERARLAREEVATALKRLDKAVSLVAPVSHNFDSNYNADYDQTTQVQGVKLKRTSQLQSFHRETITEAAEAAGVGGSMDASTARDPVALTSRLRFAKEDNEAAPIGAVTATTRLQLGAASVPTETLSRDKFGRPALDAEARSLLKTTRELGSPQAKVALGVSTADMRARPWIRGELQDIFAAQAVRAPDFSTTQSRGHSYTPAMEEAVRKVDYTHMLKADEEKRYSEARLLFDRMLGKTKGSGGGGGAAGGK